MSATVHEEPRSVAVREEPRLLHALPGRLRVHLPRWRGGEQRGIERQLRALAGVRSVQVTPLTGNVLIRFDPAATNAQALLTALRTLEPGPQDVAESAAESDRNLPSSTARGQAPRVLQDRHGPNRRGPPPLPGTEPRPHPPTPI